MLFGIVYLFLPFYKEGLVLPSLSSIPSLIGLAILPTIEGFYCTTKALNYLDANKVQFFELTDLKTELLPQFDGIMKHLLVRNINIPETDAILQQELCFFFMFRAKLLISFLNRDDSYGRICLIKGI